MILSSKLIPHITIEEEKCSTYNNLFQNKQDYHV